MPIKICLTLCLAAVCCSAYAQDDLEKQMQSDCQILAKKINKLHGTGISLEHISPLVTWRAACAEKPPTGPGNVTALCQGTRITPKGEDGIFFWQKSDHGKLNTGYYVCAG